MNKAATYAMRGSQASGDFTIFDMLAVPCHLRETSLGAEKDYIREDCVSEPEEVFKYLGNMATVAYYNYGSFKPDKFDDSERVSRRSAVYKFKTNEKEATWTPTLVHISNLEDEKDFL